MGRLLVSVVSAFASLSFFLAGCGSPGPSPAACDGFCIITPATPADAYRFVATAPANEYLWDFGDHSIGRGAEVEHVYDFNNGKVTVVLSAIDAAGPREFRQTLTRGSGINAAGAYALAAPTDWFVTGEEARFSAAASTDADGDALLFEWGCERIGDAVRNPHIDTLRPKPVAPSTGHIGAALVQAPMPEPTLRYDGDLCAGVGGLGDEPLDSGAVTIGGAFTRPGKYVLFLRAADAVHAAVSGQFAFVVTPPEQRPEATARASFMGLLEAGARAATGPAPPLQEACGRLPPPRTCDVFIGTFSLPLGASESWVNFTYERGPPGEPPLSGTPAEAAANELSWEILRDGRDVMATGGPGQGTTVIPGMLTPLEGTFTVRITLRQGAGATFGWTMESLLDRDPYKLYF